jgi:eukaryotic-like serine/threonine-protein kinase
MGLQLDAEAAASASGSGPQERASGAPPSEASRTEVSAEKLFTVHDQAIQAAAASQQAQLLAAGRAKPWRSRQLVLGVLGGLGLVGLVALGIWASGVGIGQSGDGSGDPRAADDARADSAGLTDPDQTSGSGSSESGTASDSGDQGSAELANDVDSIVARAEQALADEHWREPLARNLAVEINNLSVVDPGHEAIGRLRREAEQVLGPRARTAAKAEDWATTAAAYRDLLAIWPEQIDARDNLLEALRQLASDQRSAADYAGLLSTADELLNRDPQMFVALKYRAEAFAGLERWSEAVPAYREAMGARPSNKDVKKGYRKARRELTQQVQRGEGQ